MPELWINHGGSKCQTVNDGSERQTVSDDGSERQNWECDIWTSNWEVTMTLNAEIENATLNVKLRSDGSKRRN